jgi:hypothetical protein
MHVILSRHEELASYVEPCLTKESYQLLKVLISEEKDNLNEKKLLTTYKELRGFVS